jgi:hypothetical protein
MLKKLFEREVPKRSDEEKMSIFLNSPIIDDLLRRQNEQLLKDRNRQAGEIAKLDAELNKGTTEFDEKITAAEVAFETARNALETARAALQALRYKKSDFQNQRMTARNVLAGELKQSAPLIDDFIHELRDLYFANQNLQFKESLLEQRDNPFGGKTKTFNQSDPLMIGWYEKLDKTIREAEALKLEPDFTTFPEIIEKLRAGIVNPEGFSPVVVTVNTLSGERVAEGPG